MIIRQLTFRSTITNTSVNLNINVCLGINFILKYYIGHVYIYIIMGNELDLVPFTAQRPEDKGNQLQQQIRLSFPKTFSFPLTVQTVPSQHTDNILLFMMRNDNNGAVKVQKEISKRNNLLVLYHNIKEQKHLLILQ